MKIYIMKADALGRSLFKVGVARDVLKRRSAISTGSPFSVSVVATADHPYAASVEKTAHKELAEHRINGEWFDCSKEDVLAAVERALNGESQLLAFTKPPRVNVGGRPQKQTEHKLKSRSIPLLDEDYERLKLKAFPESFGTWARNKLLSHERGEIVKAGFAAQP